jgi:acetate kinase
MNILVINSGSSSLRYQLIDTDSNIVKVKDYIERIGMTGGTCATHNEAIREVFRKLGDIKIDAIGHRVVHGGEVFKQSTLVTPKSLAAVTEISHLAPLHNPANLMGVRACTEVIPAVPNVMVFDTAFHSSMPKSAYLYAIPCEDYEKHGIRRYGFHGTSHNFVSRKCAEMCGCPREKLRIIVCHLGGGCSVCAVDHGKSVETSMGLTPLEGLVMVTRSGDIDPAAVQFLAQAHGFTIDQTINYLNKECGLKGIGGISSDTRDNVNAMLEGNEKAGTAIEVYVHRLVKYIGAYIAVMGGVDAIVWTAGVGNNQPVIREKVMKNFWYCGAVIDGKKNAYFGPPNFFQTGEISAKNATVRTFVIRTDEELEIADETAFIVNNLNTES